jgi:hypothetical protein
MCGALRFEVTFAGIVRRWSSTQPPCSLIQSALIENTVNLPTLLKNSGIRDAWQWNDCFAFSSEDLTYLLRLQHHVLEKEHQGVHLIPPMVQISAGDNKGGASDFRSSVDYSVGSSTETIKPNQNWLIRYSFEVLRTRPFASIGDNIVISDCSMALARQACYNHVMTESI